MSGRVILCLFLWIMIGITSCNLHDQANRKSFVTVKHLKNCSGSLISQGDSLMVCMQRFTEDDVIMGRKRHYVSPFR